MVFKIFDKEINIGKGVLVVIILLLAAVLGAAGFYINRNENRIVIEKHEDTSAIMQNKTIEATEQPAAADPKEEKISPSEGIKVYVVGCVNSPGIITLKKDQLIDDAVKAAGGATKEADLNNVNLVYKLSENLMLYIKSKEESKLASNPGEAGKGVEIIRDSGGAVVNQNPVASPVKTKVNINTASVDELDTLPGIGKETAKDIISHRDKNGKFKVIADIKKVTGIKDSKFNKIKDYIAVD